MRVSVKMRVVFGKNKKNRHCFALPDPTGADPVNPGRGWYRIYPFSAKEPVDVDQLATVISDRETLCLLEISLEAYALGPIDDEGLRHLRQIFAFFAENEKDIILRMTYDLDGHAAEKEPGILDRILLHMTQVSEVMKKTPEVFWLSQGLFVGNWGEMHGSRYLQPKEVGKLYHHWKQCLDGLCPIAVRTPQLRRDLRDARITIYDDAILSTPTDLGTFAQDMRETELKEMERELGDLPVGGEAVRQERFWDAAEVLRTLSSMHVSYLNSCHDLQMLTEWQDTAWNGRTLFEEIGLRMGYRMEVRSAEFAGGVFRVTLENTGFANLTEEADLFLHLRSEEGREKRYRLLCLGKDGGSVKKTFSAEKDLRMLPEGTYTFYLQLLRKKDGRVIRFAGQSEEEFVLGSVKREEM